MWLEEKCTQLQVYINMTHTVLKSPEKSWNFNFFLESTGKFLNFSKFWNLSWNVLEKNIFMKEKLVYLLITSLIPYGEKLSCEYSFGFNSTKWQAMDVSWGFFSRFLLYNICFRENGPYYSCLYLYCLIPCKILLTWTLLFDRKPNVQK